MLLHEWIVGAGQNGILPTIHLLGLACFERHPKTMIFQP